MQVLHTGDILIGCQLYALVIQSGKLQGVVSGYLNFRDNCGLTPVGVVGTVKIGIGIPVD